MRQYVPCFALLLWAVVAIPFPVVAGGPLNFANGSAIVWNSQNTISYQIDRGDLGRIASADIQALIRTAFNTWSDVPTASIKFAFSGSLNDDVTTYADYLIVTNHETGGNVVVLDNDGDIVAEAAGEGNRNRIAGFATAVVSGNRIASFYSLMNGRKAVSKDAVFRTLVHEFGHAVGLDHTQIHVDLAGEGLAANEKYIPVMYPMGADDYLQRAKLKPDDVAWISLLYPSATFNTAYGRIKGRVVRAAPSSRAVLGANVVATKEGDAEASRMQQISCVSDWLREGNGQFVIPAPPGTYKLHVEPIRISFTGVSSVGPHANTPTSPSFVDPILPSDPVQGIVVTAGGVTDVGNIVAN